MTKDAGRPSDYNEEIASELCSRLAEGRSLRSVCKDEDMPDKATVFRWLGAVDDKDEYKHTAFRDQYARAKEEAADAMAEEIIEIADDTPHVITGVDRSDNARVQAQKMRVDTRKWIMAKFKPRKYGEKLDLTSDGRRITTPPPVYVSEIKSRNADPEAETEASS